jgi:hypothetical protein
VRTAVSLPQRLGLYAILLFVGIVAVLRLPPLLQICGSVAAFFGATGLLTEGLRHLRREQERQRAERDAILKAERKAARREREQQERQSRQTERQTQANAETLRRQAEANREMQKRQAQHADAERRERYANQVEQEAQRLQNLPPEEWAQEACRLVAGADGDVEAGTQAGEFLCRFNDGEVHAVFVLSDEREASANNVTALEALRRESGASHALLLSRTGFSLDAVRAASAFPLTLLDPLDLARRLPTSG